MSSDIAFVTGATLVSGLMLPGFAVQVVQFFKADLDRLLPKLKLDHLKTKNLVYLCNVVCLTLGQVILHQFAFWPILLLNLLSGVPLSNQSLRIYQDIHNEGKVAGKREALTSPVPMEG